MSEINILVVDDDKDIVNAIKKMLDSEDYHILTAYNGIEALDVLQKEKIQLILMDIMMPGMDGFSATMKIREQFNIPIILLSAKTEDSDKVLGLTMGADDYITKPFSKVELVARVKAQLRRYMDLGSLPEANVEDRIINGGLMMDTGKKMFYVNNEEVKLTATEFKIVELLMSYPGRVFSVEEIYEKVWQEDSLQSDNVVMVHIRRIREKIEVNPKEPRYLKVVWGIGYKIEKQ